MKRKILLVGFLLVFFGWLTVLASRPVFSQSCYGESIQPGQTSTIYIDLGSAYKDTKIVVIIKAPGWSSNQIEKLKTDSNGEVTIITRRIDEEGWASVTVYEDGAGTTVPIATADIYCENMSAFFISSDGPPPTPTPTPGGPPEEFVPCKGDPKETECNICIKPESEGGKGGVWTALGCLPTDPADFVAWLLSAAIKIGGGIAFLLMLWGGFQIMTSTGNPEKLNQGKDILISAGVGLLFIIFSVLLLKIIGIEIFELPGFKP